MESKTQNGKLGFVPKLALYGVPSRFDNFDMFLRRLLCSKFVESMLVSMYFSDSNLGAF